MSQLPSFEGSTYDEELQSNYQVKVHPMGKIGHRPIEFLIVGNNDLIDLSSITLHASAKITKADGNAYEKDAEVAFVNNALHSMFSDVIVTMNETIVEGDGQQYSHKSMINTLFAYTNETMEKQLFTSGFAKDDLSKADDVTNKGYITRKAWTNEGAIKEFYGKFNVDLFRQPRSLIPNMNFRIKLIKNASKFALFTKTDDKPKFTIETAVLYMKKIRPHPQILNAIVSNLARGGIVQYPINRIELVSIPLSPGKTELSRDQLFYGKVSKILLMSMIDNKAYNGDYKLNPYHYKHNTIESVDLRLDGESKPILPLTPNFKEKRCIREYTSLLETMSIFGNDAVLPISYNEYMNGYTFFAWNLTADYQARPQNPDKRMAIRLDIKFEEALTSAINILLYCVFDSTVMIDDVGQVITDYKD